MAIQETAFTLARYAAICQVCMAMNSAYDFSLVHDAYVYV